MSKKQFKTSTLFFLLLLGVPALFSFLQMPESMNNASIEVFPDQETYSGKNISSYIIGTNRNHVPLDNADLNLKPNPNAAPEATKINEMVAKYGTVAPRFGNKRKIYRIGHLVTDGTINYDCDNLTITPTDGFLFSEHNSNDTQYPYGPSNEYPHDDIRNGMEEAIRMNADVTMVINFADDNAIQEAKDMIDSLKKYTYEGTPLIEYVKYFEIGNEIGYTINPGHCAYACTAEIYAERAKSIINAIAPLHPSAKIGVVGSNASDWAGDGCSIYQSIGDGKCSGNCPTATPTTQGWGPASIYLPNMLAILDNKIDFLILHSYASYPLAQAESVLSNTVDNPSDIGGAFMAQNSWNIEKITDPTFDDPIQPAISAYNSTHTNRPITLANTEYCTHLNSGTRSKLVHGTLEALYTADNMLTAIALDFEMAVNFAMYHRPNSTTAGPVEPSTDLLFKGADSSKVKPVFEIHEFIAANLGDVVINSDLDPSDLDPISTIKFFQNQVSNPPCCSDNPVSCTDPNEDCNNPYADLTNTYEYSPLGYVATKRADNGNVVLLLINRSEEHSLTLDISPGVMQDIILLKTYFGDSFIDPTLSYQESSGAQVDLSAVVLPPLSVNILEVGAGNSTDPCDGIEVSAANNAIITNTTNDNVAIITIYNQNYSQTFPGPFICNSYNTPGACQQSITTPVPAGSYNVLVQFNNGAEPCSFPITVVACPLDMDVDGDGICDDIDNCLNEFNPDQEDTDGNGIGDACEGNADCFGVNVTAGTQSITTNTTNPEVVLIKILDANYNLVKLVCNGYSVTGECQQSITTPVPNGTYFVSIQIPGAEPCFVTVTVSDANRSGNRSSNSASTSLALESPSLLVYPNPAKQVVSIEMPETPATLLHLYNNQGQLVKRVAVEGQSTISVNIQDFAEGMYHIELKMKDGTAQNARFVKAE